jgi:hypothetical protein
MLMKRKNVHYIICTAEFEADEGRTMAILPAPESENLGNH